MTMLIIELLVLLLIAYEVIVSILEKIHERKRKKVVGERVKTLRDAMFEGQELRNSTTWGDDRERERKWVQDTKEWGERTRALLKSYSAHAEMAFLLEMPISPNDFGSMSQPFTLGTLLSRLNNLRSIIEKPEVYL
jgi:hypothetical protein